MDAEGGYDYEFARGIYSKYKKLSIKERRNLKRIGGMFLFSDLEVGVYYVGIDDKTQQPWVIYMVDYGDDARQGRTTKLAIYYLLSMSRLGNAIRRSPVTYWAENSKLGVRTIKSNGWNNVKIVEVIGHKTTFMNWFHENPLSSRKGD